MITQNSEVYNPPYRDLFPYNEERYVGGIVYFHVVMDFATASQSWNGPKGVSIQIHLTT